MIIFFVQLIKDKLSIYLHISLFILEPPVEESVQPISYKGKLTERLLAQGLITPSMLQELQREWTVSQKLKIGQMQSF